MCGIFSQKMARKQNVRCAKKSYHIVVVLPTYVITSTASIKMSIIVTRLPLKAHFQVGFCSEARSKRITDLTMEMITLDMRPIRLVEYEGFRQFMAFVEPGCHLPLI